MTFFAFVEDTSTKTNNAGSYDDAYVRASTSDESTEISHHHSVGFIHLLKTE